MPFDFIPTDIPDVIRIIPRAFGDSRGTFWESYKRSEFLANGITEKFCQDNISISEKGVLRGLHFQKNPHAQGKLVQAIVGEVFDVAVDLRPNSPTFGKWESAILSGENREMLYIPPGFAHGFLVLSDHAVFSYKVTQEYAPQSEGGIQWDDPSLGIRWPELESSFILSQSDLNLLGIKEEISLS